MHKKGKPIKVAVAGGRAYVMGQSKCDEKIIQNGREVVSLGNCILRKSLYQLHRAYVMGQSKCDEKIIQNGREVVSLGNCILRKSLYQLQ